MALALAALVVAACGGSDDGGDDDGQTPAATMDADEDEDDGLDLTEEEQETLDEALENLDLEDLDLGDLDLGDLDLDDLDLGDLDIPEDTEENAALRERACELLTQADAEMLTGGGSLPEGDAMLGSGCTYGPAIDGTNIRIVSLDIFPSAAGDEQAVEQSIDLANQAFGAELVEEVDGVGDVAFAVLFEPTFSITVLEGNTVFVITIAGPAGDPLATLIEAAEIVLSRV